MYYLCKKIQQSLGTVYGVMDTNDGVVEYYSPRDIVDFIKQGVEIKGVVETENNKFRFKVLEPTAFKEVESDNIITEVENKTRTEVSSELISNHLEIYYPETWGSIESLDYNYLDIIFKPLRLQLSDIIFTLFKVDVSRERIQYIDGCDCVGYQGIKIPNTNYNLSIYSNPEQSGNGEVICYGVGIDIDGLGKSLPDCHFDYGFTDDLLSKFRKWYNDLTGRKFYLTFNSKIYDDFCVASETILMKLGIKFKNTKGFTRYSGVTCIWDGNVQRNIDGNNTDFSIEYLNELRLRTFLGEDKYKHNLVLEYNLNGIIKLYNTKCQPDSVFSSIPSVIKVNSYDDLLLKLDEILGAIK